MKIKKLILWLIKATVAGILALAVACCACMVYYDPGIHITSKTGATDYVWEPGSRSFRATEGFGNIKADENGYFNTYGVSSKDDFQILLMGSSHMEGCNVAEDENAAYLINQNLKKYGISLYNISISGHDFLRCAKNLHVALKNFKPEKYVIIETSTVSFTSDAIYNMLEGNMENVSSYDSGLLYYLQKITYFKLFRSQAEELISFSFPQPKSFKMSSEKSKNNITINVNSVEKEDAYFDLMNYIGGIAENENVEVIVFYHPTLSASEETDIDYADKALFEEACVENGVHFLDMSNAFYDMYSSERVLPHGFFNTSPGEGHLNKYGHKAVADELSDFIISEKENDK